MLKRVVIKLSGEALAAHSGRQFDDTVIDNIALQIKSALADGTQIALVVGGGNFWRGHAAPPGMDRVKADQIGMLATVMNALYLTEAFKKHGVNSIVATPILIGNMTEIFSKEKALAHMAENTVVINAAGLGHPYFSTDTITALRAAELNAEMVLYAKNVDGVYNADPKKVTNAKKYKSLSYRKAIADGLNAADTAALLLSNEAGIPSLVFALDKPGSIRQACALHVQGEADKADLLQGTLLDVDVEEDFYVNADEPV